MTTRYLRWGVLVLLLCPLVDAQQAASDAEEFRFVEAMRKQGFPDLALKYLEKLQKNPPSKELAGEIPVEIAKTRLELVGDEPDITRKLNLYTEVRADLEKFLKANPTSRLATDVELSVAEIAVLQGRTALTQAIMLDERDSQETPERHRARALLVQAGKELDGVEKRLTKKLKDLPEATTAPQKADKARLEESLLKARFNIALNYFDQATTFAKYGKSTIIKERNDRIEKCAKELNPFLGLEPGNAVKWRAAAWLGRCLQEQESYDPAREQYLAVLDVASRNAAAYDGARLARYFLLLVIDDKPKANENRILLIETGANNWVKTYSRALNTAEGCGIRFLQAKILTEKAYMSKDVKDKQILLQQARKVYTSLEATENDFTDRARRKKITIIAQQGSFTKAVTELKSFEDCYVRSQFEQYEMEKDEDKLRDKDKLTGKALDDALDSARKKRQATICEALDRGLGLPDAKDKANVTEANNAKAMLSYYYLTDRKYEDCIRIAQKFAEDDPKSGQALKCAAYALQCYSVLPKKSDKQKEDMEKFLKYCKERWKKEFPGQLARHQLAVSLRAEAKPDEALAELDGLTPDYPAYTQTQMFMVDMLAEMLKTSQGEQADALRKRIITVIERTPEPVGMSGPPYFAYYFLQARLADEMYNAKQYIRVDAIAAALEKKLPTVEFDSDAKKQGDISLYYATRIGISKAYAGYGQANQAMEKNDLAKVSTLLDPIIDQINNKKLDALKSNLNLANAILDLNMRATIQQGKLDRTRATMQAFQAFNEQAGAVPPILSRLIVLIRSQFEDLKKKGDLVELEKARKGFSDILDDLTKKQDKVNPAFQIVVAACYSSMELYPQAVENLSKVLAPPAGTDEKDNAMQLYREAQIQISKAQRLSQKLDEAAVTMKTIMGDKDKPGWGRKSVPALQEQTRLYIDQKDFASAYSVSTQVSGGLLKRAEQDAKVRVEYMEAYYYMSLSQVRLASTQKTAPQKKVGYENAATAIISLERRYPDFNGEPVGQRFKELIDSDADFKKTYDAFKLKK